MPKTISSPCNLVVDFTLLKFLGEKTIGIEELAHVRVVEMVLIWRGLWMIKQERKR